MSTPDDARALQVLNDFHAFLDGGGSELDAMRSALSGKTVVTGVSTPDDTLDAATVVNAYLDAFAAKENESEGEDSEETLMRAAMETALAPAREERERIFRWGYAALVALAIRCLHDANAAAEDGAWPAGQKWESLSGSSKALFLIRAREEAGIPHDEFLALVRSGLGEAVDDLFNRSEDTEREQLRAEIADLKADMCEWEPGQDERTKIYRRVLLELQGFNSDAVLTVFMEKAFGDYTDPGDRYKMAMRVALGRAIGCALDLLDKELESLAPADDGQQAGTQTKSQERLKARIEAARHAPPNRERKDAEIAELRAAFKTVSKARSDLYRAGENMKAAFLETIEKYRAEIARLEDVAGSPGSAKTTRDEAAFDPRTRAEAATSPGPASEYAGQIACSDIEAGAVEAMQSEDCLQCGGVHRIGSHNPPSKYVALKDQLQARGDTAALGGVPPISATDAVRMLKALDAIIALEKRCDKAEARLKVALNDLEFEREARRKAQQRAENAMRANTGNANAPPQSVADAMKESE